MASTKCNVCNIRNAKTGSKGTETSPHNDMCNYCFEEGGMENQHSDHNHDYILAELTKGDGADLNEHQQEEAASFMPACWICHPELNLAKLPGKKASTGTKKQGDRRPQLNHLGHQHPQTPAARRACKALFWATYGTPTAQEFAEWDAKLDGFGKPAQAEAKPAKAPGYTLVSTGPKNGVVKQLKAAKPAKLGQNESAHRKAAGLTK